LVNSFWWRGRQLKDTALTSYPENHSPSPQPIGERSLTDRVKNNVRRPIVKGRGRTGDQAGSRYLSKRTGTGRGTKNLLPRVLAFQEKNCITRAGDQARYVQIEVTHSGHFKAKPAGRGALNERQPNKQGSRRGSWGRTTNLYCKRGRRGASLRGGRRKNRGNEKNRRR